MFGGPQHPRLVAPRSRPIRRVGAGRIRQLLVQRLAGPQTASEKLRPRWNRRQRAGLFGEEAPECRLMPAERVSGAVPVGPDARAQPPRLGNQLLAHHRVEIFVHDTSLPNRYERRLIRVVRRTRFGQHAYQRTALAIIGQPDVCFKMEGMTRPQDAGGNSWPVPSSTSSWAPRISFCNAIAWPSGNTGSFAPWMTSVGVSISASRSREEPPTSMTKWFTWLDAMLTVRSSSLPTRSRIVVSSKWPDPPENIRRSPIMWSITAAR